MGPITLCYHDLVASGDVNASGFPTPSAATYKLDPGLFIEHTQAIARVNGPAVEETEVDETTVSDENAA